MQASVYLGGLIYGRLRLLERLLFGDDGIVRLLRDFESVGRSLESEFLFGQNALSRRFLGVELLCNRFQNRLVSGRSLLGHGQDFGGKFLRGGCGS